MTFTRLINNFILVMDSCVTIIIMNFIWAPNANLISILISRSRRHKVIECTEIWILICFDLLFFSGTFQDHHEHSHEEDKKKHGHGHSHEVIREFNKCSPMPSIAFDYSRLVFHDLHSELSQ